MEPLPASPPRVRRDFWGDNKKGSPVALSNEASFIVPGTGLEPVRLLGQGILSPSCLPIPPSGQQFGCKDNESRAQCQIKWVKIPPMWQKYMPSMIFMANRWDECRGHRQHSCHPFTKTMPRRILSSAKPEIMIIFSSYRLLMANVLFP